MKRLIFVVMFVISFCKAASRETNTAHEECLPLLVTSPFQSYAGDSNGDGEIASLLRLFPSTGEIKDLNLSSSGIEKLPNDVAGLRCLKRLNLANNRLGRISPTVFSTFLKELPQLSVLDVSNNQISKENMQELNKVAKKVETQTNRSIEIIIDDLEEGSMITVGHCSKSAVCGSKR